MLSIFHKLKKKSPVTAYDTIKNEIHESFRSDPAGEKYLLNIAKRCFIDSEKITYKKLWEESQEHYNKYTAYVIIIIELSEKEKNENVESYQIAV